MTPKVTLLAYTPNPTRVMGLAARLCYSRVAIAQLNDAMTDAELEKLVQKILANKHHSVLEHAVFTFGVEGVSRDFSHQMVRHRNTSYEQQSLHYIIAPDGAEVARPIGLAPSGELATRWDEQLKAAFDLYHSMIKAGIPREEARHVLPSGIETRLIMTANLRQWMYFIRIRACVVNCHEITAVAMKIKRQLEAVLPYMRDHLGPECHTERTCHEGTKFCGAPWQDTCTVFGDLKKGAYGFTRAK